MRNQLNKEVIIVGCGPLAVETAQDLAGRAQVLGAFSVKGEAVSPDLRVPKLGRAADLGAYLAMNPVDEVYLTADIRRQVKTRGLIVGIEGLQDGDRLLMKTAERIRHEFLSQNAYTDDAFSTPEQTAARIGAILAFHDRAQARLKEGALLDEVLQE